MKNNTNLLRDEAVDKDRSFDLNIILSPLGSGIVAIDRVSQLFFYSGHPWLKSLSLKRTIVPIVHADFPCSPFSVLTDKYRRNDLHVGRFVFSLSLTAVVFMYAAYSLSYSSQSLTICGEYFVSSYLLTYSMVQSPS